jgi:hypothetical protein
MVRVHSATGANTFSGSIDILHPDYQVLKEARQTEDFEGYVGWALGLSKLACMRVFTLNDPARLVVDSARLPVNLDGQWPSSRRRPQPRFHKACPQQRQRKAVASAAVAVLDAPAAWLSSSLSFCSRAEAGTTFSSSRLKPPSLHRRP